MGQIYKKKISPESPRRSKLLRSLRSEVFNVKNKIKKKVLQVGKERFSGEGGGMISNQKLPV